MNTIHINRIIPLLLCTVGLFWAACGEEKSKQTDVEIIVQNLDADINIPFVSMGHSSTNLPYGGKCVITPADSGTPRSASISFENVSEGESYRVDYIGYDELSAFPARPPATSGWLCYYERATKIINVVSGIRNVVTLSPDAVANRCVYLGASRYVVNPNYVADASDPGYGSLDGENTMALFIRGAPVSGNVTVKACDTVDPNCTTPFGVFATLPDGVFTPWPAHTGSGWERELTVPLTGYPSDPQEYEALVYLVVKPGASPQLWEIEVDYPSGTTPSSEIFRVRLSNGNRIDVRAQ